MSEYILTTSGNLYTIRDDEFYHYGVKGMKWGVRKKLPTSDIRDAYDRTKKEKRAANRAYSKAFNKASANPLNSVTKKGDKLWNDAYDKGVAANKADAAYKKVKTERKQQIAKTTNELRKNATRADKLVYNDATRKLAAKYVVDNNMSVEEATKRAKGDAWRNTAIFVGAYGAIALATLYANS